MLVSCESANEAVVIIIIGEFVNQLSDLPCKDL
jgi:hypothetical protein